MTIRDNQRPGSSDKRYVVISADSHDGPPYDYEKYAQYMDPQHRDAYTEWLKQHGHQAGLTTRFGGPSLMAKEKEVQTRSQSSSRYRRYYDEMMVGKMEVSEYWLEQSFGRHYAAEPEYLDPIKRVAAVETQGIVAEVVNTTGLASGSSTQFGANDHELYRAGAKAHLRWLADFCGAAPGRLAAPIYIDGHDLGEALEDIRWARKNGVFGGVFLPIQRAGGNSMFSRATKFIGDQLPPYLDAYWEPLWSICVELDLPVVIHVGQNVAPDIATAYGTDPTAFWIMSAFDHGYFAKRPFFQMIAGGVFDRHPKLKYCLTETHVASLPGLFQEADHQTLAFDSYQRRGLGMRPSEYWFRNGFAAASLLSRREVARRHDIGVENLMFGSDFPHPEGTWPNTLAAQRHIFEGVPEAELRAILGENAARCFGFDLDRLRTVADRVGPTVAQLATPLTDSEKPEYPSTFSFHTEAA